MVKNQWPAIIIPDQPGDKLLDVIGDSVSREGGAGSYFFGSINPTTERWAVKITALFSDIKEVFYWLSANEFIWADYNQMFVAISNYTDCFVISSDAKLISELSSVLCTTATTMPTG